MIKMKREVFATSLFLFCGENKHFFSTKSSYKGVFFLFVVDLFNKMVYNNEDKIALALQFWKKRKIL